MAEQHSHGNSQVTGRMVQAANQWLDSLNVEQKAKATFHYLDGERIFWYYPPLNRHGLPLRDMDASQRDLAYALMATGLTESANARAKGIMQHELILGPLEKDAGHVTWDRNPELYYWTVFGEPGGSDPWGWRVEGHHVSLHLSIWGDDVISVTPFFFGANPAEVPNGPEKGKRLLDQREDIAIDLMASLDAGQRSQAILHDKAPWDIIAYNSSKQAVHEKEGLACSQMSGTQKEIMMALITEYITQADPEIAEKRLDQVKQTGLDDFYLVWAGGLDRSRDHYYRIHGGNFIIEFDNVQNSANHIHSVWRDVENDFAQDVLRQHHLQYHIL